MKNFIMSLVLIFLIFSSTTAVYASFNQDENVYLDNTSDFYIANETLITDSNKTLIPLNQVRGVNDVYYVTYEYELIIKDGYNIHAVVEDLTFSNQNVTEDTISSTFNFEIDSTTVKSISHSEHLLDQAENADVVVVTVTISMNEPATYDDFTDLVGGYLSFETYFFVSKA